jgi:hypothetical protein
MSEQCFVFVFHDCCMGFDNLLLWICEVYYSIALRPGVYSARDRNEYQKQKNNFSGEWRPVRKADNLTAICESIV